MTEQSRKRIRFLLEERKWSWNKFPKVMKLYLYLLDAALREDEPYGEIMLYRGDVIYSLRTLSEKSGMGISSIRTALKKLRITYDVEFTTYGHTRIIHINDYDRYMDALDDPEAAEEDPEDGDAGDAGEDPEDGETGDSEEYPEDEVAGDAGEDPEDGETGEYPEDLNEGFSEESGAKQEIDTMVTTEVNTENTEAAPGSHRAIIDMKPSLLNLRKADALSRILSGTVGGYRGANYSGETRVRQNTESLVKLCNSEKENVRKRINNTLSLHTHNRNPGFPGSGYRAPGVYSVGDSSCGTPVNFGNGVNGLYGNGENELFINAADELFGKFWDAYPRHVNRYQARVAFARLNPDAKTMDMILKALSRQKESEAWHVESGRYIPYPARWLSERRWEDDPAESERKYKPRQYTVPAQNYEQRDYSEEMETPEEMLARLKRGVGFRS